VRRSRQNGRIPLEEHRVHGYEYCDAQRTSRGRRSPDEARRDSRQSDFRNRQRSCRPRNSVRSIVKPGATIVGALLLASCGQEAESRAPVKSFALLAGSELKDVETQLKSDIRAATSLDLVFTYSGTLDAIERIAAGEQFDALWVSHGKYLSMDENLKGRIVA